MLFPRTVRWLTVLVTLLCGCSSHNKHATTKAGPDASAPAASQASRRIGPEGGTVSLTQGVAGGASVTIPAGALSREVTITVRVAAMPKDLPNGARAAGPVVDFGPNGQTFALPVVLRLPTQRQADGVLTRSEGRGVWTKVSGARMDMAHGVMIANVTHFTPFVSHIAGGDPDLTDFPATGYVMLGHDGDPNDSNFQCFGNGTGTLIAPDVVLTAAHVVRDAKQSGRSVAFGFGKICEGNTGVAHVAKGPCDTQSTYPSIYLSRDLKIYDKFFENPGHDGPYDIGVIYLNRAVSGVQPALIHTSGVVSIDCNYTAIGYGLDETNKPGNRKTLSGGCVGAYEIGQTIVAAFLDASTCPGDSGGPLYDSDGTIVGVLNSTTATACSTGSLAGMHSLATYASVPDAAGWITAQMKGARAARVIDCNEQTAGIKRCGWELALGGGALKPRPATPADCHADSRHYRRCGWELRNNDGTPRDYGANCPTCSYVCDPNQDGNLDWVFYVGDNCTADKNGDGCYACPVGESTTCFASEAQSKVCYDQNGWSPAANAILECNRRSDGNYTWQETKTCGLNLQAGDACYACPTQWVCPEDEATCDATKAKSDACWNSNQSSPADSH